MKRFLVSIVFMCSLNSAQSQNYPGIPTPPKPGDKLIADYFALQTKQLTDDCLAEIETADDWKQAQPQYRAQLFEMLGMQPMPERKPLEAKVTGLQTHDGVVIENVVFQSLPGLYVTANFYRPSEAPAAPLPAILYVCGHSGQKEGSISFGNKTAYHHHGLWFAKHGYVCLTIDTVQLGEIEGIHHGTYREGRWWWNARGYSSAGIEAWNGIRALDYMATRAEVDAERIGMTGRSGGGAYSWWVSALDERVKVAVPVAGIASLHNHVVDGTVEGHCDCMFHVNTYRWDFPAIAALVAPRPLLIANTDKDTIFPLDGVVDVYTKTRRIYKLLGAEENIGLAIAEGPHKDTQPLRTEAFHWFERHLRGRAPTDEIDTEAPKLLDRTTMRALKEIPEDEIVTKIDESFVRIAPAPEVPADQAAWETMRDGWMKDLRATCFRGWPQDDGAPEAKMLGSKKIGEVFLSHVEIESQAPFRLPLVVAGPAGKAQRAVLIPVDEEDWTAWSAENFAALRERVSGGGGEVAVVLFAPRGVGPTSWTSDPRERIQVRRRFMLLGETLDGMRVWDIRRAIRATEKLVDLPVTIEAEGAMAGNSLYASLFEKGITGLRLKSLPSSHRGGGPIYLNVLRFLDIPAAVAMAAGRCPVTLSDTATEDWRFASGVAERLGWQGRFEIEAPVLER